MDLSYANDIPLWSKLLVLLIGIVFTGYALRSLEKDKIRGHWFLPGIRFNRKEEKFAFWFYFILWFGMGVAMLIYAIILFIPW